MEVITFILGVILGLFLKGEFTVHFDKKIEDVTPRDELMNPEQVLEELKKDPNLSAEEKELYEATSGDDVIQMVAKTLNAVSDDLADPLDEPLGGNDDVEE